MGPDDGLTTTDTDTPMPTSSLKMAASDPALKAAVQRSRKLLHKRALVAAAASTVPLPGLDWAVDAALLSRLLPQINAEFGLSAQQIDQLDPQKREQVQKAVSLVGSVLIGKLVTRELVLRATQTVGMRLTTKQAAKYVPIAGQAVAAGIGYATLRYLGEQHLRDCVRVVQEASLQLPAPAAGTRRRKIWPSLP